MAIPCGEGQFLKPKEYGFGPSFVNRVSYSSSYRADYSRNVQNDEVEKVREILNYFVLKHLNRKCVLTSRLLHFIHTSKRSFFQFYQ